ncbi:hypothetical protein CBS101457_002290 [Exobasidium rhododendri]|nr:hypothetical protein CBS101457_002290 [Exobasidium rhododendri]
MTATVVDDDTTVLLSLLSQLPAPQLAIAVSQHSDLSFHVVHALRRLAAASVQDPASNVSKDVQKQSLLIADLVRKLISRGDPSLVRKLLPNQSSLVDFALCTNAKDLLSRLIDESEAINYIRAASLAYEKAATEDGTGKDERAMRISKAARILACIVSVMPGRRIAEDKLTKGQRERGSEESDVICKSIAKLQSEYQELKACDDVPSLQAKVSILDAAWSLAERFIIYVARSTKRNSTKEIDVLLEALCGRDNLDQGSIPLVDMPMMVDLALIKPLSRLIVEEVRPYSSLRLDATADQMKRAGFSDRDTAQFATLGSAWKRVISSVDMTVPLEQVPVEIIESVLAILPYLDQHALEERLSGAKFLGKDAETVIQLLLEEEEVESVDEEGDVADVNTEFYERQEDEEALRMLQERANIFDSQDLTGVKVIRGKSRAEEASQSNLASGLSEDIRAAILARAEEPDSDEEEEWNPFSEAAFEVGFEEEMEEEVLAGKRSGQTSSRNMDDDYEEGDDEEEDEEGERQPEARAASLGESDGVASERAAERILIGFWSERGEAIFAKDARKSALRTGLKAKLNDLSGRAWDDALIESWATMFARNPRKEKLLASVDDIMRLGNQNIASTRRDADGEYGPDKGRGGRIMTGQRGGQGGRGGRGGGGGRGSRGSSRGGRGNRGARRGGRGA